MAKKWYHREGFKTRIIDALLIVFSVLFALFLNNWSESRKQHKKMMEIRENLLEEISTNLEMVKSWKDHHLYLGKRLDSLQMGKLPKIYEVLHKDRYQGSFALFKNQPLIEQLPNEAAWNGASATGIVSEMNFDEIILFSNCYNLQKEIIDVSIRRILDMFFDAEKMENMSTENLITQYKMSFHELISQEYALIEMYEKALAAIH